MSETDPITQFFTAKERKNSPFLLYTTLELDITTKDQSTSTTQEQIRRAYRKVAVKCHPDKHAGKSEDEKAVLVDQFQKVGFAYAVLSDEKRKARYDSTGNTSEGMFDGMEEGMEWAAYFDAVFTKVDKKMLDEDRIKYQGSEEETADLLKAYQKTSGDLNEIMNRIPHSTGQDESRFIEIINEKIADGEIESCKKWKSSSTDKKAKKRREKTGSAESKQAEKHAKDLGIWEEMYGDTKPEDKSSMGKRAGKEAGSSSSAKRSRADDEEDLSGLAAMIARRQSSRETAMDALFEKYSKPQVKGNKKKK